MHLFVLFSTVLLFIAVLSVLAGATTAALADVDGGRHRGRLDPYRMEEDHLTEPMPRACQAPSADDLSYLLESVAGVSKKNSLI